MKSKIIQELGLEILEILDKERKRLREQLHPMNLNFKEDEYVSFTNGALAQAEETYLKLYSTLNLKYNQTLAEERNDTTN